MINRFPKDEKRVDCWLKAIKLKIIPTKYTRICSEHFKANDYKTAVGNRNHILLKDDAIPSVFNSTLSDNPNTSKNSVVIDIGSPTDIPISLEDPITSKRRLFGNISIPSDVPSTSCNEDVTTPKRFKRNATFSPDQYNSTDNSPCRPSYILPKKGRPNNKNLPTPVTPIKRKLKSRVKVLQQKVRRLNSKILNMQDLLAEIKKKKLIDDDAQRLLENEFEGTHLELFKNELSNKKRKPTGCRYSEELKKFALTLNYYSPKAYKFCRSVPYNFS